MAWDQREFVRAVKERLGLTTTELGQRLGKRNAYGAVNSWETDNPKNFRRLSYVDTMALLELAGWLNVKQKPRHRSASDPLQELLDGVAELLDGQKEILDEVRRGRRRAPASPEQAAPSR